MSISEFIGIIPHIITFSFYLAVLYFATTNWIETQHAIKKSHLKLLIVSYLGMTIYSVMLFLFNQGYWVYHSHGKLVGDFASYLWIIGDHSFAITWLASQLMLRMYLRHVCHQKNCKKPCRRKKNEKLV